MISTESASGLFRYPGGKTKSNVRKKILGKFPYSFSEYREAFTGGGGIFFGIDPATVELRWINDLNTGLIEVYKALRDRPKEFISLCRSIEPPKEGEEEVASRETSRGGKKYNKRLKEVFDNLKYNESCDQALRYFFINRTVWGGRVNYDPAMESRMYFSNPEGWNIVQTNKLEQAARWLKDVKITSLDFADILAEPGNEVVIYCDPPYVVDTELAKQSKLYEFGFNEEDHYRFAKSVKECKHKVIISYDDHPLVRELFPEKDGFHIFEEEWLYCGTSSPKGSERKKKAGKELVITNFEQ